MIRRLFGTSLAVIGLLLPAPLRADDAAAALLAKHRSFVGWQYDDGTFKSWRLKTSLTLKAPPPGPNGEEQAPAVFSTTEVRRGAFYRKTTAREGSELIRDDGFTGRVYWDSDYNGNVVTHFAEDTVQRQVSYNALFDDAVSTLAGTARGSAQIGDTRVQIVRVTPNQGFAVDLYVDADGAYRRAIINPEGRDDSETIEIDKYTEALPGKKIIGSYHFGSNPPYEVTSVEPNIVVADDDLRPPRPRTNWTFDPAMQSVPIEIRHYTAPIGDAYARAVVVRASFNGHEGLFLLDSGAGLTLLFNPFAETLGLASLGRTAYSGVNGGAVSATLVRIDELSLGKNVLHNVIAQRSSGRSITSLGIDGIIGYDVLARAIVDVDLVGLNLTVLDPARFTPNLEKGAYAFPVDLTTRQPAVHITVGNGVDAHPVFDTGASFEVLLSDQLQKSGKVVALVSTITFGNGMQIEQRTFTGGVDGSAAESEPCSRISRMDIGPYRFENAPICFGNGRVFGANGGLIGFDFLRHFNWTFDYPENKLVLTPNGVK